MKLQKQGKIYTTEEQIGFDMEKLIRWFSGAPRFINMASYKDMVRVFSEQFVDNDGKAELNPHPGGKILQYFADDGDACRFISGSTDACGAWI